MTDIDGYILIGGASSRFGRDKALVSWNGRTFLENAAGLLDDALPEIRVFIVVARHGQFDLPRGVELPVVADIRRGLGAWSGLHAALSSGGREWAFVLACDLPLISPELIRRIVGARLGFDAVIPRQADGRLQPLCAVYRRTAALAVTEEAISKSDGEIPRIGSMSELLSTRIIEPAEYADLTDSERLFANINTEADLARL